jgi:hypothetical protein
MLQKLEYICAVLAIALMGADRIDLLAGQGSFRLTPFDFFAALVVLYCVLRMAAMGRFHVTLPPPLRRQIPYVIVLLAFLFFLFLSTILGIDPERGVLSLAGFFLVSVLGYCMSTRVLHDPTPNKLILRAVTVSLIVYLVFCIGQWILWNQGVIRAQEDPNSSLEVIFAPVAGLFWVPRLSGFLVDENRAGFTLVMFLALLDKFTQRTRYTSFLRFVIVVFLLFTFSRSAILCWFAYVLFSERFWRQLKTVKAAFSATAIIVVCSLAFLVYRTEIAALMDLWQISDMMSERANSGTGSSTKEHIELIERGFNTWLATPRTVVSGIGFAASYKVLPDIWKDNKYGNFHDLFVTVLAEGGLPAFLLFMTLVGYPLFKRRDATSWIAAIAVFNIPYQSPMEPVLWFSLALLWSLEPKDYSVQLSIPARRNDITSQLTPEQS